MLENYLADNNLLFIFAIEINKYLKYSESLYDFR